MNSSVRGAVSDFRASLRRKMGGTVFGVVVCEIITRYLFIFIFFFFFIYSFKASTSIQKLLMDCSFVVCFCFFREFCFLGASQLGARRTNSRAAEPWGFFSTGCLIKKKKSKFCA